MNRFGYSAGVTLLMFISIYELARADNSDFSAPTQSLSFKQQSVLSSDNVAVPKTEIATYIWGGLLQKSTGINQFYNSVSFMLDQGFTTIRFAATPGALQSYGLPQYQEGACSNLPCMLSAQLSNPIFDDPRLHSIYITMQEFTDNGEAETNPNLPEQDKNLIRAEYDAAFDYLAARFSSRPIRITILNWEGDNYIYYCGGGGSYGFATNPTLRASCMAQNNIQSRVDGFIAWSKLRKDRIEQARLRHPGFDLRFGVEFNNAIQFSSLCKPNAEACANYPTVLSLIPQIDPVRFANGLKMPFCSYSSYDSLATQTLAQNLPTMFNVCDKVILGEVGYNYQVGQEQQIRSDYNYFVTAVTPFLSNIPAIVYWNGFDDSDHAPTSPNFSKSLWLGNATPLVVQFIPPSLGPKSH